MVRDTLKDARYFDNYIMALMPRIERFRKEISDPDVKRPAYLIVHIIHLLHDCIYAQYSAGYEASEIKETFLQYLSYIKMANSLTYDEAMNVLSFGILFNVQVADIFDAIEYPEDSFLKALIFYNKEHEVVENASDHLMFPKTETQLARCFDGKVSGEELGIFVSQKWYELNNDETWYDTHQSRNNTYCGYWCFSAAAIAKVRGFNPHTFRNTRFFPVDLM